LFTDKRNQIIADEVQQKGTVDHTPVYVCEVVKRALELSATAIGRSNSREVSSGEAWGALDGGAAGSVGVR
jgi:hypothetical protein